MKKFLQKFCEPIEHGFGSSLKDKVSGFVGKHPEISCLLLLTIGCLMFLFLGLNLYPLMDVDETRYAVMARDLAYSWDWNTLLLNKVPFLEKPPLYFWLVASSIKLFGGFSAFAVRFPIALLSSILIFFTYFMGKTIISRKFGMISAFVLLSSLFFLIFSHVAIIDMVLTFFMTSAIYFSFLTHFCEDKYKKYCWWLFYTMIGAGFLAKGILALAIPGLIIFIYNLITKTVKEIFKPLHLLPGLVILLICILPWHLDMYKIYGFEFIKQYFLIHHFGRFMGSEYIGRERPLWYFIPVFLMGFMPWTFIFIAFLIDSFKKLGAKYKAAEGKFKEKISTLLTVTTNEQKMLLFFSIFFIVVFLVFSSSSTKLPSYILPAFPAAAMLTGYFWWVSDEKGEYQESIYYSTLIFSTIFILAAIVSSAAFYFLPYDIQFKLLNIKEVTITAIYLLAILLLTRLYTKRALSVFSGYIFVMFFVVTLAVSQIFNFVYATGENELVLYSMISAYPDQSTHLVTFDFAVKPSTLIVYKNKVDFITDPDFKQLDELLKYNNGPTFVIIKNKNFKDNPEYKKEIEKRLELVQKGEKYSLYVKDVNDEYNNPKEFYKTRKRHARHHHKHARTNIFLQDGFSRVP